MDGVALASVISTASVSLASVAASVWATRFSSRSQRSHQRQERLSDVYLEVLKTVHRGGQWVQALAIDFDDRTHGGYRYYPHVAVPPNLELSEMAHVAALVGAFASTPVKAAYEEWAETVVMVDRERETIVWNTEQEGDPDTPLSKDEIRRLTAELAPQELRARRGLENVVSHELAAR